MVTKLMLHCHIMLVWTCISTPSTKLSRLVYLSFDLSCTFPILLCFLQRIPRHTKVTVTWWKLWIRHLKIQIIQFSECDHSKKLATKNISFILAGYLAIVLLKCGNVSNSNSVELNVHQSGHSSSVCCWHGWIVCPNAPLHPLKLIWKSEFYTELTLINMNSCRETDNIHCNWFRFPFYSVRFHKLASNTV